MKNLEAQLRNALASVDSLQNELMLAKVGESIAIPGGHLSTANAEAIGQYITTLTDQITRLEEKVEATRKEKEEELVNAQKTRSAALSQSTTLSDQVKLLQTELASLRVTNEELEKKVEEKEEELQKALEEGKENRSSLQKEITEELSERQRRIEEAEKKKSELSESIRQLKMVVSKKDNIIEAIRSANEKLKKNEGVYKQVIEQLRGYVKEREHELEELYKGMKISK